MASSGGSRQVLGRTQENNRAHLHERGAGVPPFRACQRLTVRPADPQAERRANLKRVVSFEEYASDPTGTLRSLLAELPYHERRRPDANALACAASHARSFACWAGGGGGGWVGTESAARGSGPRLLHVRRAVTVSIRHPILITGAGAGPRECERGGRRRRLSQRFRRARGRLLRAEIHLPGVDDGGRLLLESVREAADVRER